MAYGSVNVPGVGNPELEAALHNAVTVPSGAAIEMGESLGEGPYTLEFEEDGAGSAVSADQVSYDGKASGLAAETVQGAVDALYARKADASRTYNLNLLDNWYLVDPINQRGQKEYTGAVYGIDRWKGNASHVRIAIESDGLTIGRVSGSTVASTKNAMQFIEDFHSLAGETITISALVSRATASAAIFLYGATASTDFVHASGTYSGKPFLLSCTVTLPDNIDGLHIHLRTSGGADGDTATFAAAKLELGPVQTLAHQDADGSWVLNDPPPNKAPELAKCQRYQITIGQEAVYAGRTHVGSDTGGLFFIPLPSTMRAKPAVSGLELNRWYIRGNGMSKAAISIRTGNITPNGITCSFACETGLGTNRSVIICKESDNAVLDANL